MMAEDQRAAPGPDVSGHDYDAAGQAEQRREAERQALERDDAARDASAADGGGPGSDPAGTGTATAPPPAGT